MSRRTSATRVVAPKPESTAKNPPAQLTARMSAREGKLRDICSSLPEADAGVAEVVVGLMVRAPEWSTGSDRVYVRYLCRFADWVQRHEGHFDPAVHMSDQLIHAWVEQTMPGRREASRHTAYLAIRRIRDTPSGGRRRTVRQVHPAPYRDVEWHRFEAAAASLAGCPEGEDLRMLLDLTGEAGLRGAEAIKVDGHCINVSGNRVSITVANRNGVARTIPVFGDAADRLRTKAGKNELLLRPHRPGSRHNAISDLIIEAQRSGPKFGEFKASRARGRWLLNLLEKPVPFAAVAVVADIGVGSHAPTDVLNHAGRLHEDDVATAIALGLGGAA